MQCSCSFLLLSGGGTQKPSMSPLLHHAPPHLLIIIFLFVTSSLSLLSPVSPKCDGGDRRTLLKIKRHFGNDHPFFATWNPATDCCSSWDNVVCYREEGGPVNGLFISYTNLSGSIPFDLFAELRSLDFLVINFSPNLTGTLPPSITDFTSITQLTIASTAISGPIPRSICNLTKVALLDLSANRLTGRIPDCLRVKDGGGLLDLGRNRLSGPIPASLGINTTYTFLNLDGNRLSGSIPSTFAGFDYNHLNLSGNRLTGDASFLFWENLEHAGELDISRNKLEFDLSNVTFPVSLNTLKLSNNKIYGSIPQQISKLRLSTFDVSYNRLCGPVPTVVGFVDPSSRPLFEHNKCLCGAPLKPCPSL